MSIEEKLHAEQREREAKVFDEALEKSANKAPEFPGFTSEYLSFELDDHYEGKTERVTVISKKRLEILGEIKWFGRWRQYAFFPADGTIWNSQCLEDVDGCLETLALRRNRAIWEQSKNR